MTVETGRTNLVQYSEPTLFPRLEAMRHLERDTSGKYMASVYWRATDSDQWVQSIWSPTEAEAKAMMARKV